MKTLSDFFNPKKEEIQEELVEQKNVAVEDTVGTVFNTLYANKLDSILNEIKNCTTKEEVQSIAIALIEHVEKIQKELQKEVKSSTISLQEKTNFLQKKLSELSSLREEEDKKNKAFVYETVLRQEENANRTLSQVNDLATSKIEKLEEEIKSDINLNLEAFTKRYNRDLQEYKSQIKKQSIEVERIEESLKTFIAESKKFLSDEKYMAINNKIKQLENILEHFNEKTILVENILSIPPSTETSDPLTPLDQNFVTHEQLVKHYQLFINRVQQQLTTLGGGGAAWLNDLQDVNYNAVKSATDGQVLTYNAANALWEVSTISGSGNGDVTTADLTTANVTEVTNLYFTNARSLAALTTNDAITIESITNNVEITANADVNIVALDDLRLTGNDTVALRNRSNSASINIITDFDDQQKTWEFGADGKLTTPGDITVVGDITGTASASTLYIKAQQDSNTFIQLNNAVDSSIRTQANLEIRTNGLDPLTWVFDTNGLLTTPSDVNIEGGLTISQTAITGNRDFNVVNINSAPNPNAYIQLNETGDSYFGAESNVFITTGGDFYEWKFGVDSTLTLPGNLSFTSGCTFSEINSVSNSSGDGIGASTLQIVPDNTLFNNDQYIIVDPTEPDHIHIRGGGDIDNCSAKLIFGGENSHFSVQAGANASVGIRANNYNWNFGTDGVLLAPGSITSDGIISTGKSSLSKVMESFTGIVDATGVVTHNCSNTHIFNHTSIDNNFTANFTNLSLNSGEATSLTLVLNQGPTAYIANAVQIGGVAQTIKWQANAQPTGNVNAVDIQTFSVLNTSGTYIVLGQLTTFG